LPTDRGVDPARPSAPGAPKRAGIAPSASASAAAEADGRRVRGDLTRARILRAALQAASKQGLNGVTIGQVADAAGVSKGHIGILFGTRENLQLATIDAAVGVFRENVLGAVEQATTARGKLRAFCLGWFDYVRNRVLPGGCLVTAATSEFRTIDGAVREKLLEMRQARLAYLRSLAVEAQAEVGARGHTAKAKPGPSDRRRQEDDAIDLDDFVYQVLAYQAAANVAWLLDDARGFEHARRATVAALERIGA
jgi:AcrR family transcriptional regulator